MQRAAIGTTLTQLEIPSHHVCHLVVAASELDSRFAVVVNADDPGPVPDLAGVEVETWRRILGQVPRPRAIGG